MNPPPSYTVPLPLHIPYTVDDIVLITDFDTTSTYVFPHYSPAPPPNRTLTISLIVPLPTAPTVTHGTPFRLQRISHMRRSGSLIDLPILHTRGTV